MREFVLGIDASLSSTGWAVIDRESLEVVDVARIQTRRPTPEDDRIDQIIKALLGIMETYRIRDVALEDGYMHKNLKTGMQLAKLRGGIIFVLRSQGASVSHMQPAEIKQVFVGQGNAKKETVAAAIQERYPENPRVLALGTFSDKNNKSKNSDMYDAISIGVAHILKRRQTPPPILAK